METVLIPVGHRTGNAEGDLHTVCTRSALLLHVASDRTLATAYPSGRRPGKPTFGDIAEHGGLDGSAADETVRFGLGGLAVRKTAHRAQQPRAHPPVVERCQAATTR